ncbi:peroxide stress protein YaaA [Pandoraea sp.]|uniref:peroxide stress protein YaaA n=1 Tax=Pandoraea sp. TaxID=1883445 RepID=UPI001202BF17|nr:peroxide stress protein YaaA [Pandoraea sp.]TAL55194.1 MAG: peroxide stress protein YaaA [Pandoraea sp.]TAM18840.1 MAG: peroxide stress protein YaaA [Pandoraea sp.]
MIIVLSPAKSLDFDTPPHTARHTLPQFIPQAHELIETLRTLGPAQVAKLMNISDPLAALNVQRYADWSPQFSPQNAKQAILAFNGDVYEGLDAKSMTDKQIEFAQRHVRILSGLYGLLRPLDLLQPYRLEMGTRLHNAKGRDLYAYWDEQITQALNAQLAEEPVKSRVLVNLASEEYFKSVRRRLVQAPIITPVFEDWKNGKYKIISFYAKRARGLMARYAVKHGVRDVQRLRQFDSEGYAFAEDASTDAIWVFRRKLA